MATTIISLREHPEKLDLFCRYFSSRWGKPEIYRNCIESALQSAWQLRYPALYCCTDHIGFYEKYHFEYIGTGYHPWDETSRIYRRCLVKNQWRGFNP